jgi:putative ABC transport system permease protein
MLRVTLKGVRGHLLRFMLTAIAVTLGVSLVAGTYILTDSLKNTFDGIINEGFANVDVNVRGVDSGTTGPDGLATRSGLPLSLQRDLERVPGTERVQPDLQGYAVLVGRSGTAVRTPGAPTLGFAYDPADPLSKVVAGRGPSTPGEIAVESSTLARSGLRLGDTTGVLIGATPQQVTVVGEINISSSLAGATLVVVDPQTGRSQFAPGGMVPGFTLVAAPGVSQQELRDRVSPVLPAGAEAVTGRALAQETSDQLGQALGFINTFLLVFAGVSLFVGSFIIANTFSMLVAQRTRELALLRAVGASRGQVIRVVLGEAAILGVFGSVLGLGAGVVLAGGLRALFSTFGLEVEGGLPVQTRTVVVSLLIGTLVTLVSAILPALRASRVAPVAAMRDDQATPVAGVLRRGLIGVGLLAAGAALVVPAVLADDVRWIQVAVGAVLVVVGALVAAPAATRPVVRLMAFPFVLMSGTVARLARENALRNPRRTAATASALMIGLALMAGVSVIASSTKASVSDIVESQLTSDFVLDGGGVTQFPGTVQQAVAALPAVSSVASISNFGLKLNGEDLFATATDAASITDNVVLDVTAGSLASLDRGEVLIEKDLADEQGWAPGTRLTGTAGMLTDQTLVVGGVYAKNQIFSSPMIVPRSLYEKAIPVAQQGAFALLVKAAPEASLLTLRAELEQQVKPFIIVAVQDGPEFVASQADQVNQVLYVLYVLLALSVVIAVLGIINTLALSVFERTREIGLLRAVGMSRTQLRRMITVESVFTAVFGAILGALLGLAFGLAVQRGLVSQGLETLSIPWGPLLLVVLGSALAGLLAAVLPAWRAVRLNMLQAISTD